MSFATIPPDLVRSICIAGKLPVRDIFALCRVNQRICNAIRCDKQFWIILMGDRLCSNTEEAEKYYNLVYIKLLLTDIDTCLPRLQVSRQFHQIDDILDTIRGQSSLGHNKFIDTLEQYLVRSDNNIPSWFRTALMGSDSTWSFNYIASMEAIRGKYEAIFQARIRKLCHRLIEKCFWQAYEHRCFPAITTCLDYMSSDQRVRLLYEVVVITVKDVATVMVKHLSKEEISRVRTLIIDNEPDRKSRLLRSLDSMIF
jgi:hypothetical protein